MINFMVICLPRSGSAWLANLLTTDDSICLHESLAEMTIDDLDSIDSGLMLGISETSACFISEAIEHPCKKLIVERSIDEINESLLAIHLPAMPDNSVNYLYGINGYRISFDDLFDFDEMSKAYEFLLGKPLSKQRHEMLCKMNIQNQYAIEYVRGLF